MTSLKELRQNLSRSDLTIEELVDAADGLLSEVAPKQTRYKVAERPDVRTIRFYITQKLLPAPSSYEGGRARYTGSHLLRLLVIKKMQSEHSTLRQIAHQLEAHSDEQLLAALQDSAAGPASAARPGSVRGARSKPVLAPPEGRPAGALVRPAVHSTALQRFALLRGVTLDIEDGVLRDPAQRRALADELDTLATMLRQLSSKRSEGDDA